jgi:hypothetical protein
MPAGPHYDPNPPPPKPRWKRWGFSPNWTYGKGSGAGKHHKGIFVDTPLFRLDAGLFPRGWTFKVRR